MKKNITNYDLKNKKVIIRCDFNVPIKDGKIVDDNRIVMSLETIKYAIDNGAKVILMSHLGSVEKESDKKENDLYPVSLRLSKLLGQEVYFSDYTRGEKLEKMINNLKSGEVLLIQNTRYEDYPDSLESNNDEELAKYWASLGDIFINDAFGTIHRKHASNVGISKFLPNGIGFLIQRELDYLSRLNNPERPFVVIMGGAKVKDKIKVIENLVEKADYLLIGGAMAFTFLKAKGFNIGKSILDTESITFCQEMLEKYEDKIIIPVDANVSTEISDISFNRIVKIENIKDDEIGLDIGPDTIKLFSRVLENVKTVFWNGPLGMCEIPKYTVGTKKVMEKLINLDATTILGGGDTVAAFDKLNCLDSVTYASTGGGATLKYLEGKMLPGLEFIEEVEEQHEKP